MCVFFRVHVILNIKIQKENWAFLLKSRICVFAQSSSSKPLIGRVMWNSCSSSRRRDRGLIIWKWMVAKVSIFQKLLGRTLYYLLIESDSSESKKLVCSTHSKLHKVKKIPRLQFSILFLRIKQDLLLPNKIFVLNTDPWSKTCPSRHVFKINGVKHPKHNVFGHFQKIVELNADDLQFLLVSIIKG